MDNGTQAVATLRKATQGALTHCASNGAQGTDNAMEYTLTEAAAEAGKDRATLFRAIKKGRLSARRLEDGSYVVDAAELHRVYPAQPAQEGATQGAPVALQRPARAAQGGVEAELRKQIAMMEETIADLRASRDAAVEAASVAQAATRDAIAAIPKQLPSPAPQPVEPQRPKGLLDRLMGR